MTAFHVYHTAMFKQAAQTKRVALGAPANCPQRHWQKCLLQTTNTHDSVCWLRSLRSASILDCGFLSPAATRAGVQKKSHQACLIIKSQSQVAPRLNVSEKASVVLMGSGHGTYFKIQLLLNRSLGTDSGAEKLTMAPRLRAGHRASSSAVPFRVTPVVEIRGIFNTMAKTKRDGFHTGKNCKGFK